MNILILLRGLINEKGNATKNYIERYRNHTMNILIASDFSSRHKGNFINTLVLLEKEAVKNGHTVYFAFPYATREREWCQSLINEGLNIIFTIPAADPRVMFTLLKLIKQYKIDIIHTHFGYHIFSALACKLSGKRCLMHIRSKITFSNKKTDFKENIKKTIYNYAEIISSGKQMAQEFSKFLRNDKIYTVENGIFFSRLDVGRKREEMRKRFGFSDEDNVSLLMGYDTYVKGVDIAIDAFKKCNDSKYKLAIVAGKNEENLKKYISKNYSDISNKIILLPENDNIGEYYRMVDNHISASRSEGFSNAVAEAIYSGKNILLSDIPGTKWAEKYEKVFVFQSESSDDLVRALKEAESSCSACNEIIKKDYDVDAWVNKIIEIYNN